MAFIVDEQRRVCDPEREMFLVPDSGGSGGELHFFFRGPDFDVSLWAYRSAERIEGASPELPPPLRTIVTWKIGDLTPPPGWGLEDFRQVITEAFTAYKLAHGVPDGQLVKVLFAKNNGWGE